MAPIKTAIAETRRRKLMESTSKKRKGEGATSVVAKAKATTPYRHRKESSDRPDDFVRAKPLEPVKKAAKKAVKQAKKTVKAAAKTVKKAAGTALKSKNTYTTSGTHAGGRKSSASRKIKRATSLKKNRGTSLRLQ